MVSDLVAGWAVDRFGAGVPFAVAGLGCLVVAAALPFWLPDPEAVRDSAPASA